MKSGAEPKPILPPTYFLIALLSIPAFAWLFPQPVIAPGYWNLLGLLPLAAGLAMTLIADQAFQRAHTTVKPFEESSILVTSGMYQVSRNPTYLGFTLSLVGVAILLRAAVPFLVCLAFVVWIERRFIVHEERMLAKKFGSEWQTYRTRVRRWL